MSRTFFNTDKQWWNERANTLGNVGDLDFTKPPRDKVAQRVFRQEFEATAMQEYANRDPDMGEVNRRTWSGFGTPERLREQGYQWNPRRSDADTIRELSAEVERLRREVEQKGLAYEILATAYEDMKRQRSGDMMYDELKLAYESVKRQLAERIESTRQGLPVQPQQSIPDWLWLDIRSRESNECFVLDRYDGNANVHRLDRRAPGRPTYVEWYDGSEALMRTLAQAGEDGIELRVTEEWSEDALGVEPPPLVAYLEGLGKRCNAMWGADFRWERNITTATYWLRPMTTLRARAEEVRREGNDDLRATGMMPEPETIGAPGKRRIVLED